MSEGRFGSTAGLHCHHDGCVETLVLTRKTTVQTTLESDYERLLSARDVAAQILGWRTFCNVLWCPTHVAAKKLVCPRCLEACRSCWCVDAARMDAVEGSHP